MALSTTSSCRQRTASHCLLAIAALAWLLSTQPANTQAAPIVRATWGCGDGARTPLWGSAVVVARNAIVIRCERAWFAPEGRVGGRVELWTTSDEGVPGRRVAGEVRMRLDSADRWTLWVFASPALEPDREYVVVLHPVDGTTHKPLSIPFSTAGKAKLSSTLASIDLGREFVVESSVAFKHTPATSSSITEVFAKAYVDLSKKAHPERVRIHGAAVQFLGPEHDVLDPDGPLDADLVRSGRASVKVLKGRIRAALPTLRMDGLVNVFGRPVDASTEITLAAVPKTKDDASQFYKASVQTTHGSLPGVALDIKFKRTQWCDQLAWCAPFRLTPDLVIDVDENVEGSQSTNTIRVGVSTLLSQLRAKGSFYQAASWTAGPVYERNRENTKRNALLSVEWQPYFKGFMHTREMKQQEVQTYPADTPGNPYWGYSILTFLSVEGGGALKELSVQNEGKTSSVTVPKYGIARVRPRLNPALEFQRVTVDWSVVPRLLLTPERSVNKKTLELRNVTGVQLYQEIAVTWTLDRAKHFALESRWKVGRQPPDYAYLSTLATGLVVKF
jgi:hypothetical protein